MILFRIVKYLKYILLAHHRKGHGIHSPFVFDLVSRVFKKETDPAIISTVEKIRTKLISDRRKILVRDLGAGSQTLKPQSRFISEIARHSPVSRKYGRLLSNLAGEFGKPLIIELGTSFGISTMYMAASCKDSTVYTIEGCSEIAAIAKENFTEAGLTNIKIFEGSFDKVLPDLFKDGAKPGLIFIDGNHRKEAVIKYFNMLAEISGNKTAVIIDDINYSKEMGEAWKEIKLHKKISVSIDICRMGILFFREGINHNDYVIRY
jgi:predicted O-methyltransferase YrrM